MFLGVKLWNLLGYTWQQKTLFKVFFAHDHIYKMQLFAFKFINFTYLI